MDRKKVFTAAGLAVATALGAGAFTTFTHVSQGALDHSDKQYTDTLDGDIDSRVVTPKDNSYDGMHKLVIFPLFAAVDTHNEVSRPAYPHTGIQNEFLRSGGAGEYDEKYANNLDSFQLALRGQGYSVPLGRGSIGFFYSDMPWKIGNAIDGSNGFGGSSAAVGTGTGTGNSDDDEVLSDSTPEDISGVMEDNDPGLDQNLPPIKSSQPPIGVPEPPEWSLLLLGLLVMSGLLFARSPRTGWQSLTPGEG